MANALTSESFLNTLKNYTNYKRFIVAFSGGLDSSVLVHLCAQLKNQLLARGLKLEAVYIDHQLQSESAQWATFCRSRCQQYQIPFQSIQVDAAPKKRQSPEAAARDARYQALKKILTADDCLLTAHHQSDQAETLLLQMLRGSGPKGLAAMPLLKPFYQAHMLRPLLTFSQAEIKAYAEQQQLEWIDDKSNLDLRYKRNFLRHQIMPALMEQWPAMEKTLHRVTHLQAESVEILEHVAQQDIESCEYQFENDGPIDYLKGQYLLSIARLQQLSSARINNAIQYWLRSLNVPVLNSVLLERLQSDFIFGQQETQPLLEWQNQFSLRRFKGFLILCSEVEFDSKITYQWHLSLKKNNQTQIQIIAGTVVLNVNATYANKSGAINPLKLNSALEIRFRQGRETFKLANQSHHSLKKWFQENAVPPWLRDRIPLFFSDNQLFQVGNYLVDKSFMAANDKEGVVIRWNYMD